MPSIQEKAAQAIKNALRSTNSITQEMFSEFQRNLFEINDRQMVAEANFRQAFSEETRSVVRGLENTAWTQERAIIALQSLASIEKTKAESLTSAEKAKTKVEDSLKAIINNGKSQISDIDAELSKATEEQKIALETLRSVILNRIELAETALQTLTLTDGALEAELSSSELAFVEQFSSRFTNDAQVAAFKAGVSLEKALEFSNFAQVAAFEAGASPDAALRFTDLYQVAAFRVEGTSVENALLFNERDLVHEHLDALRNGATATQALGFESYFQVEAFRTKKITYEQAFAFNNYHTLGALKAGANFEEALKFTNEHQVNALRAGATPQEALRFENEFQVEALRLGVNLEQALEFMNSEAVDARRAEIIQSLESKKNTESKAGADEPDVHAVEGSISNTAAQGAAAVDGDAEHVGRAEPATAPVAEDFGCCTGPGLITTLLGLLAVGRHAGGAGDSHDL